MNSTIIATTDTMKRGAMKLCTFFESGVSHENSV